MTAIRFVVRGTPQPKGSARAFLPKGWTRPVITSANPNLKSWEATIKSELQRVMAETPRATLDEIYDAPVRVSLMFRLARPKSLPKRVIEPTKKPDLDKLVRGAIDALNGVLFHDDAQVIVITARKAYAESAAELEVLVESLDRTLLAQQESA